MTRAPVVSFVARFDASPEVDPLAGSIVIEVDLERATLTTRWPEQPGGRLELIDTVGLPPESLARARHLVQELRAAGGVEETTPGEDGVTIDYAFVTQAGRERGTTWSPDLVGAPRAYTFFTGLLELAAGLVTSPERLFAVRRGLSPGLPVLRSGDVIVVSAEVPTHAEDAFLDELQRLSGQAPVLDLTALAALPARLAEAFGRGVKAVVVNDAQRGSPALDFVRPEQLWASTSAARVVLSSRTDAARAMAAIKAALRGVPGVRSLALVGEEVVVQVGDEAATQRARERLQQLDASLPVVFAVQR